MNPMRLDEIAAVTDGTVSDGDGDVVVRGATIDSRDVHALDLFVALNGENSDGHGYAEGALAAGAAATLAARPVPGPHVIVPDVVTALGQLAADRLRRLRESGGPSVTAMTGSVGKTTTKDLLATILSGSGETVAPVASFNNELGVPLTVLRADSATRFLVLEMGADHLGEIDYLASIAPPDVGLELGVGVAHIGEFGGVEAIARAKAELVRRIVPGGVAVLNIDNEKTAAMAPLAPGPVVAFGSGEGAHLRFSDVRCDADGLLSVAVSYRGPVGEPWPLTQIETALPGEHNAVNVAAACAAAACLGLDGATVAEALRGFGPQSPHRLAITDRPDGVRIIDDSYNANPQSMAAGLRTLAGYRDQGRRTIAVVGQMLDLGEGSHAAHRAVGELAAASDVGILIAVGAGAAPAAAAAREAHASTRAHEVRDNDEAYALVSRILQPGDVALLKGSKDSGVWQVADRLVGRAAESDG